MEKSKMTYDDVAKTILKRFIPALILIIILVITKHLVLQYDINSSSEMARVINISGRQRMLSQKITKDVYAIFLSEDDETAKFYLDELETSTDIWKESNIDLKNGKPDKNIPGNNSDEIMTLFSDIEVNHQAILEASYNIINMAESGNYNKSSVRENLNIINMNEIKYLSGMDDIVLQYEKETDERLKLTGTTETVLFYLILLMIVFTALFIFFPAIKSLSKAFDEVEESYDNMMKLFKTVHGAMFLIDQDTYKVILMNKQAEDLIQVENSENEEIYFDDYFQLKSEDFCNVMNNIITNEKNENIELEINFKDNSPMKAILTSVKIYFNKKAAILIGLFDISEQKQAEETYKNLAATDKLTGLLNRYSFEKRVDDEIKLSDRYDEPISMLLLDLDHFKNVNDTWGHPVGDDVLKQAAETIRNTTRKSDYVFRVGGEEFVVLMTRTNISAAHVVAEKIRVAFNKTEHKIAGIITASIGVAERMKSEPFDSWYKKVDKALYCAKESGRNCVVNYDDRNNMPVAIVNIEWKNEFESGNKIIDEQHKELLEIANSLIYMSLSHYTVEKVMNQLEKLINHIAKHFDDEIQILVEIGYPDYEEHSRIHKKLIKESLKLKESYANGELKVSAFFSFIVDEVVLGHMANEDAKFFKYTSVK